MPVYRYRKPEVLGKVPADGHAVIEASAGTGKTFTLEHLIVELLLEHDAGIEEVLVVTFTEKATAELKARVRAKLEELVALDADHEYDPDAGDYWIIDEEAKGKLTAALLGFDSATISTIHGFCYRVLTEHAFANRQLFEQTQIDGRTGFARAFREVLREDLARRQPARGLLRAYLSPIHRDVGKLERLVYDCARGHGRLEPGFDARALTDAVEAFDVEAAGSIREALRDAGDMTGEIGELLERVTALVRRARPEGDLGSLLGGLDAIGAETNECPMQVLDDAFAKLPEDGGAISAVKQSVTRLREHAVPLVVAVVHACVGPARKRFEQTKRQTGTFDFDDMLAVVQRSLQSTQGEVLLRVLRDRYRYALIDEFQDTDDIQWSIFQTLFFDSDGGHRMFLIGDPKQAIYSFRGADVYAYLGARDAVVEAGGAVVALDQCFRATEALIEGYNAILRQDGAPFFTGRIHYDQPVRAGRPELAAVGADGEPVAPVHLFHLAKLDRKRRRNDDYLEALTLRIGAEIRRLLDGGLSFENKPVEASDIFILTRKTKEGYFVGRILRQLGIPHAYYKQDGLFQTAEARYVADLLAAVEDPHDRSKRYLAWLTPFFDVPLEDLEQCADVPGSHPLMQRLFDWKVYADRKQYERLFTAIVEQSGLIRRELFFKGSERELTNYQHIFEVLLEEVNRTRCTLRELLLVLRGFIDETAGRLPPGGLDRNVQRLESEKQAVQIMTMHMAKGLEAPVVFLVGGFSSFGPWTRDMVAYHDDDGARVMHLGPGSPRSAKQEEREEDQRMMYVAVTRAKARLYLPYFGPDNATAGVPGEHPGGKLYAISPAENWTYRQLNTQLRRIVEGDRVVEPGLFSREFVTVPAAAPPGLRLAGGTSVAQWSPDPALLAAPAREPELDALRAERRGYLVTSYSQMKAAALGRDAAPVEAAEDDLVEIAAEVAEPEGDELPPGRTSGSFLHSVIEEIDLDAVAGTTYGKWARSKPVAEVFRSLARRYGIDGRHLPHAQRLVHRTLASPVALGAERRIDALAAADGRIREMEFVYPIPEADGGVHRGFVKGYVDYVFRHDGLAYFVDWKSDALASWRAGHVAEYVADNYLLQAKLYTIALVKLLGVTDEAGYEAGFGGLLYCFMRGMRRSGDGTDGVYFQRPSWSELQGWHDELLRREQWGRAS